MSLDFLKDKYNNKEIYYNEEFKYILREYVPSSEAYDDEDSVEFEWFYLGDKDNQHLYMQSIFRNNGVHSPDEFFYILYLSKNKKQSLEIIEKSKLTPIGFFTTRVFHENLESPYILIADGTSHDLYSLFSSVIIRNPYDFDTDEMGNEIIYINKTKAEYEKENNEEYEFEDFENIDYEEDEEYEDEDYYENYNFLAYKFKDTAIVYGNIVTVEKFMINGNHRKKGYGTIFLKNILKDLKSYHLNFILLEPINFLEKDEEKNKSIQTLFNFYSKFGFEKTTTFSCESELVLYKKLNK